MPSLKNLSADNGGKPERKTENADAIHIKGFR